MLQSLRAVGASPSRVASEDYSSIRACPLGRVLPEAYIVSFPHATPDADQASKSKPPFFGGGFDLLALGNCLCVSVPPVH